MFSFAMLIYIYIKVSQLFHQILVGHGIVKETKVIIWWRGKTSLLFLSQ